MSEFVGSFRIIPKGWRTLEKIAIVARGALQSALSDVALFI